MHSTLPAEKVHPTLKQYMLADGMEFVLDADKSHGSYMHDAKSGRDYLDLFSFFATQPLAYNHPKMNNDEFRALLGRHAVVRPSLSDVYTSEFAKFVDTFGRIAGRGHFEHYFFIEGGALGVENALKAAFDWKVRKNLAAGKPAGGQQIIHFQQAFHGRSGYTLSLTNTFDPKKHMYFAKFDWPRVVNPKLHFPLTQESLAQTIEVEKQCVAQIHQALKDHPDDIAGLIIEPIQGEGGDNHFRKEFMQTLRDLADEHEFLLIFDEVQTGIGITGSMWQFENIDVKPDLIAYGKKVQVAGCAATDRIDEVEDNVFQLSSRINSTWGGNLVDMIRCRRFLEIIEQESLLDHVQKMGAYTMDKLHQWSKEDERIGNVRGQGLFIAFDLPDSHVRDQMMTRMWEQGALILPCGQKSLRLRPHLDITQAELDHAFDIFNKAAQAI